GFASFEPPEQVRPWRQRQDLHSKRNGRGFLTDSGGGDDGGRAPGPPVLVGGPAGGVESQRRGTFGRANDVQAHQLRAVFEPRPVRPLRVHLKVRWAYDFRFRELAIVGHDYLTLGIPAPLEREAIYDNVEHVRLEEIDHIDRLGAGASSA